MQGREFGCILRKKHTKHVQPQHMQTGGLMERIAYIGIDVHKDTNTACLFARNAN